MTRTLLVAAMFLFATAGRAAVMFDRDSVTVGVGEEVVVRVTVTTMGGTGGLIEFTSCHPSIADITGRVEFPPFSHGGSGEIFIRGLKGGSTGVCSVGAGALLPVTVVTPKPVKRRAVRR